MFKAEVSSNKVGDQAQDPNTNTGSLLPQEDINWLTQRTHYTSEEIQILYNGFLRDFPGKIEKSPLK